MTSNKERLLKVREIFHNETDEEHELSYDDMIIRLQEEFGVIINEKAVKNDIKTLIKEKPHLTVNRDKYGKKYFSFQERLFEIYELRLLMDAVSSARFITINQRNSLIEKIKNLASKNQAERLVSQIYVDDMVVGTDEGLKYTIDGLHTAIQGNDYKLKNYKDPLYNNNLDVNIGIFKYGRYDLHKNIVINEKLYKVVPLVLVMNNGLYYLVAFNIDKEEFINYRVDRMRGFNIIEQVIDRSIVAKLKEFGKKEHLNSCFNMYPGKKEEIKIKFDSHLINAIIDRFGKDVKIKIEDEESFVLKTEAAINTGLVRWILNWGADAIVLEPDSLIEMVKNETEKMFNLYHK